jgi:hypothetical protein
MVLPASIKAKARAKAGLPYTAGCFYQSKAGDQFWTSRIETNRTVTIPASFERCKSTGRVKNFQMAAEGKGKFCTTYPFDDTDIYKTIEGASYSWPCIPIKSWTLTSIR